IIVLVDLLDTRLHARDGRMVQQQLTLQQPADQDAFGNNRYRIDQEIFANEDELIHLTLKNTTCPIWTTSSASITAVATMCNGIHARNSQWSIKSASTRRNVTDVSTALISRSRSSSVVRRVVRSLNSWRA